MVALSALQFGFGQIIDYRRVVPGQLGQLVEPTEHDLDALAIYQFRSALQS
jgi:hypothetical protein